LARAAALRLWIDSQREDFTRYVKKRIVHKL
jgi:hypothetical protein